MVLVGGKAYIVAEVNDVQAGEAPHWDFIYCAMSIVDLQSMSVNAVLPFARSEQAFANATLPVGTCFVPRIIQKDARMLRCFFASEKPGVRQSQTWYRDFDLKSGRFADTIHHAKLKTATGTHPFQPHYLHEDAAAAGLQKRPADHGAYPLSAFFEVDGRSHVTLNNFPGKQNALAVLNDACDTFEILGHFNEPQDMQLSEAAVNRLPDGTWMAICRRDDGDRNYTFAASPDGRQWSPNTTRPFVPDGVGSKPTFDRFGDHYYLGWQQMPPEGMPTRSIFNLDTSTDGVNWQRRFQFKTDATFHYPAFHQTTRRSGSVSPGAPSVASPRNASSSANSQTCE